jgi:DHA1 family bicyclomycin/chloramphenicol resistance-like MFS transporter
VVRDLFERNEAARIFSALILVMGAAPMFAPLLGGKLLIWADWRAIFWCLSAIGMVCLAAVIWRMPETHKKEHIQSLHLGRILATYLRLLRDMRFLAYALIGGLSLGGMFAYIAGSPFVFINLFGFAPDDYALVFGLTAFGFVATAQVNGYLIPRFGPARLLSAGTVAFAVGSFGLVLTASTGLGGVIGFVIPVFVAISALGLMLPNTSALALASFPDVAGSASALLGCIQFSFAALAAAMMGAMHAESAARPWRLWCGGGWRGSEGLLTPADILDSPPHRP